jgi:hypothetical protein
MVSFSGKRRALIPPSLGYINENLKPIPEEVTLTIVIYFYTFVKYLKLIAFSFIILRRHKGKSVHIVHGFNVMFLHIWLLVAIWSLT